MQTTKANSTKKIPAVKHFYDIDAAKKAKKLAKKVVNSNLAKTLGVRKGTKKSAKPGFVGAALVAPVAIQIGTSAALAAGGYALWRNRDKVQSFVTDLMNKEASDIDSSMGA